MKLLSKLNLFVVWRRMKTYINNVLAGLDITGAEAKDLLWTNPDPSAAFPAQTISLDLSEYEAVEIVFSHYSGNAIEESAMIHIGSSGYLTQICNMTATTATSYVTQRQVAVKTTGVVFNGGGYKYNNSASYNTGDLYSVPYRIYGIRKVKGVVKPAEWTPADWIVERGASGAWTWEKWNSGLCVAQFKTGIQGVAITTAYGNMWRSQAYTYSYPTGVFKSVKTADLSVRGDGLFGAITNITDTAVSAHLLSPFSHTYATTATYNFWSINVYGTWK